jgi:hypothetical protein
MPYTGVPLPFVAIGALAVGLICGYLNLWLLTETGRRLADSGNGRSFVLSSLFRIGLFAIVAVVFAAIGPWWSMAAYIIGLFVPLALHAVGTVREHHRE